MIELNPEQRNAVAAPGPVCLTASAGSGKTAVLVERYLSSLSKGARPADVLAVTFTRKAGAQLRSRIYASLKNDKPLMAEEVLLSPWIGTLHSFCLQVIAQWGSLIGAEQADILTPLDRAAIKQEVSTLWMSRLDASLTERLFTWWTPNDLIALADEALSEPHGFRAALAASNPEDPKVALLFEALTPLLRLWEEALRKSRLRGFDDLEDLAVKLLRDFPAVRTHYQHQFKAVLVDEFQDTSPAQWTILECLLEPELTKLFVVGDPKQSIYRFRHADVRFFLNLASHIEGSGGSSLNLSTCYRSKSDVVSFLNAAARTLFEGTPLADNPMVAGQPELSGRPVRVIHYPEDQEAETVAAAVAEHLRQGTAAHEMALLFRNGDRMGVFADALGKQGVPIACEPNVSLFSLYEVQDLAAYLRALNDATDDFTLSAFLRTPYAGLSYAHLASLKEEPGANWFSKLKSKGWMGWFTAQVEAKQASTQVALSELFTHTRTWPAGGGGLLALFEGLAKAPTLQEAVEKLGAWEKETVLVPTSFANHQAQGVRLLTVHAAKGLEFEEVFLVDPLRRPPTRQPWFLFNPQGLGFKFRQGGELSATEHYTAQWEAQREEERKEANRILYVALTRAKSRVSLLLPDVGSKIPKGSWADSLSALVKSFET